MQTFSNKSIRAYQPVISCMTRRRKKSLFSKTQLYILVDLNSKEQKFSQRLESKLPEPLISPAA